MRRLNSQSLDVSFRNHHREQASTFQTATLSRCSEWRTVKDELLFYIHAQFQKIKSTWESVSTRESFSKLRRACTPPCSLNVKTRSTAVLSASTQHARATKTRKTQARRGVGPTSLATGLFLVCTAWWQGLSLRHFEEFMLDRTNLRWGPLSLSRWVHWGIGPAQRWVLPYAPCAWDVTPQAVPQRNWHNTVSLLRKGLKKRRNSDHFRTNGAATVFCLTNDAAAQFKMMILIRALNWRIGWWDVPILLRARRGRLPLCKFAPSLQKCKLYGLNLFFRRGQASAVDHIPLSLQPDRQPSTQHAALKSLREHTNRATMKLQLSK